MVAWPIFVIAVFVAFLVIGMVAHSESQVGNPVISGHQYRVDSGVTDHGDVAQKNSVAYLANEIGTSQKAELVFDCASGVTQSYPFLTAWNGSSYGNLVFDFRNGAQLKPGAGISGVTIRSPSNIKAQPNQQIVSGTSLYFQDPGTVYPEWFDIDGTADEVQINYAHTSLTAGGEVELRGALYTVAAPIYPAANTKTTIKPGTTVKLKNEGNDKIFFVNAVSNVTIEGGGIIDGNKANQSGTTTWAYCVYAVSSMNTHLRNVTIKDSPKYAVTISGTTDFRMENCTLKDAAEFHVYMGGDWYSIISRNKFSEAGYQHIQVNTSIEPTIDSNDFVGTTDNAGNGHGIFSYYPYGFRYTNNLFKDVYGWGIEVQSNVTGYYGNIIGNRFVDCGNTSDNTGAIWVGAYGHTVITGNTIRGSKIYGIYLAASVKCTVIGNTILDSDTSGQGISLVGAADDNIVIGNFVADEQAVETMTAGITFGSGNRNVFIGNNTYDTGTYDFIYTSSTGNPPRIANVESLADWEFSNNAVDETNEQTLTGNLTIQPQYGRTWILNGGAADRAITPGTSYTWPRGKSVKIINSGSSNSLWFNSAACAPSGVSVEIAFGKTRELIYSGTTWYTTNYY